MQNRFVTALWALALGGLSGCRSPAGPETDRIAELEQENSSLRKRIEELEQRLDKVIEAYDEDFRSIGFRSGTGQIDAVVLEVKQDLRLVILNKGEKDGIKEGYIFDVYRRSTYKGAVRIEHVEEVESTGVILNEMVPISRGDAASTSP